MSDLSQANDHTLLVLYLQQFRDVAKKKKRVNVGIFPKSGTPLPPVWEFFPDFTVYFWEVSHVKNSKKNGCGIRVDPPPVFSKFTHFPVFFSSADVPKEKLLKLLNQINL